MDVVASGIRFTPLLEGNRILTSRNRLGRNAAGFGVALRRHQDLKLFPAFPADSTLSRRVNLTIVTRSSNNPEGQASKSLFSFNIIDALAFLIRIPVLILGFLRKEQDFVEKVEDSLDNAAETVGDVAEAVEKVAGFVEKVAESIAEDAKETRELMDKVEATADSMRSDIDAAIDTLQGAADPTKPKTSSDVSDAKATVAEATARATDKARKLKDAAAELEEKQASASASATPGASGGGGDKPHQQHFRAVTPSRNSSRGSSITTSKLLVWTALLIWGVVLSSWGWEWRSAAYGALLKHAFDFLLH